VEGEAENMAQMHLELDTLPIQATIMVDFCAQAVEGEAENMVRMPCWRHDDMEDGVIEILVDILMDTLGEAGPDTDVRQLSAQVNQALAAAVGLPAPGSGASDRNVADGALNLVPAEVMQGMPVKAMEGMPVEALREVVPGETMRGMRRGGVEGDVAPQATDWEEPEWVAAKKLKLAGAQDLVPR
jgi:hypothetical protein